MSGVGGILLVDKPVGITSAKAVAVVKRVLVGPGKRGKAGPKVGHLGTLDPFASGLLPLCVGEGTKIAPYLNTSDKAYTGTVRLGLTTDTLDATGRILEEQPAPDTSAIDLDELSGAFSGVIEQVPPAFSAIKKEGVRMYELARRGEAPVLEPRTVTIHRLHIEPAGPAELTIEVECSKGTYIRSLARDIGARLGCGAVLSALRRTAFGTFRIEAALRLADIEAEGGAARAADAILPPAEALAGLQTLTVGSDVAQRLRNGQQAALAALAAPPPGSGGEDGRDDVAAGSDGEADGQARAKVVTDDGALAAIVAARAGRWRLERVFR